MDNPQHIYAILDALDYRIEELERRLDKRCDREMRAVWTEELETNQEARAEFMKLIKLRGPHMSRTINTTPTWRALVPALVEAELLRLAEIVDAQIERERT